MNKRLSLYLFAGFLLSFTLACNLLSNVTNQVNEVKDTAVSVATLAGEGQKWIETARAVATEVGDSGLLETAQAYATQVGESGFLETAQAYATEEGPAIAETAKAIATRLPSNSGEIPEDIPVLPGENEQLFGSNELVSYTTGMDINSVVEFYKTEMPNKGWEKGDQDSLETSNIAYLYFKKQDRSASVVISVNPLNNKTLVVITIGL
jgi:hypothetical protein